MKTMRILCLGVATIALSGCSFLGLGGQKDYSNYNAQNGYYAHQAPAAKKAPKTPCHNNQCLARWNLEGGIGPSFIVGGQAVTGDETNDIEGVAINNISMNDAYDTGIRAELGGSYALNPNRKVTAMAFVDRAESSGRQDWGQLAPEENLTGALTDYKSYGAELGLRQYFAPRKGLILPSIRPYVEGRLGATHVDDISITGAQVNGTVLPGGDIAFYQGGWVGSAAGLVGVETPLTRYSTIGLETGVRYTQGLRTDKSDIGPGNPLGGTNNGSSRTSIPVMLRGRYRF
jgi:hypothetical protein